MIYDAKSASVRPGKAGSHPLKEERGRSRHIYKTIIINIKKEDLNTPSHRSSARSVWPDFGSIWRGHLYDDKSGHTGHFKRQVAKKPRCVY